MLYEVITTSNIEIDEVNAAIVSNIKNKGENTLPPGICSNTFGNVLKTNPGPSPGFKSNAKTAGNITNPAKIAIIVSAKVTCKAVFPRLFFLFSYNFV